MIIGQGRFSYLYVFEPKANPSGKMKYSCCFLLPKAEKKMINAVLKEMEVARAAGIERGVFTKALAEHAYIPLRDGDKELTMGKKTTPEYKKMFFFNCSSDNKPGIVDSGGMPIADQSGFYSGCWGYVDVNFYPYNTSGNVGIGAGLNNVLFHHEDERLDGRMKAEDAFKNVISKDDVDDSLE